MPEKKAPTKMDLDHAFKRRDWDAKTLARVQKLCLAFPEVVETEQFGGPWWKAGKKAFCAYGGGTTKDAKGYHALDGATLKLPLPLQRVVLKDPRFSPEMMMGRFGWTHLRFDGRAGEWDELASLLETAYRGVANKRQIAALDD